MVGSENNKNVSVVVIGTSRLKFVFLDMKLNPIPENVFGHGVWAPRLIG